MKEEPNCVSQLDEQPAGFDLLSLVAAVSFALSMCATDGHFEMMRMPVNTLLHRQRIEQTLA